MHRRLHLLVLLAPFLAAVLGPVRASDQRFGYGGGTVELQLPR